LVQPADVVNVIVLVPVVVADAVYTPVAASIVPTAAVELLHVPVNDGDKEKVVVVPVHTEVLPRMAPGLSLTVTTRVAEQPATVYEIVAVPAVAPVTRPAAFTLATAGLEELHIPPVEDVDILMELATQTDVGPVIAAGTGHTNTLALSDVNDVLPGVQCCVTVSSLMRYVSV
jgi:hypothetical protein